MKRGYLLLRRSRVARVSSIVLVAALVLFVIVNVAVYAVYAGQTYPNARVAGKQLGSASYREVSRKLERLDLLADKLTVSYEQKKQVVTSDDLGLAVDSTAVQSAVKRRHWLPVWNLVSANDVPLALDVDNKQLEGQLAALAAVNKETPVNARIVQGEDGFTLVAAKNGSELDMAKSKAAILAAARRGGEQVALAVRQIPPEVTDDDLAPQLKKLQAAQATAVHYTYAGQTYTPSPGDIAGWYREVNGVFSLSEPTVKAYLVATGKRAGIRVQNLTQAVEATRAALDKAEPLSFALEASPYVPALRTFTYCTAVRGVDAGLLPELDAKLLSTYADLRGWGLEGAIDFVHAASGCDFTVWLSAADQIGSFGAICDPAWSCTVRPNVVINYDRWKGASDAWNAATGNLDDYRSMVINHETGHWLGFNHKYCSGLGQAAPVMQQQSIDLMGCTFNPWPLASEQAELRGILGI